MQLVAFADRLDFYPRPPGGGRRAISRSPSYPLLISIHALRVEGDMANPAYGVSIRPDISIHALRVEGDGAIPRHLRGD